jgi:hypothetical protein
MFNPDMRPTMVNRPLSDQEIIQKLQAHPQIRERIGSLLAVVDAQGDGLKRADDAEERLIEELRRMGQEAMQAWATGQVHRTEQDIRRTGRAHREGKKNSTGTPPSATSA